MWPLSCRFSLSARAQKALLASDQFQFERTPFFLASSCRSQPKTVALVTRLRLALVKAAGPNRSDGVTDRSVGAVPGLDRETQPTVIVVVPSLSALRQINRHLASGTLSPEGVMIMWDALPSTFLYVIELVDLA
jgi:hypothetical protein